MQASLTQSPAAVYPPAGTWGLWYLPGSAEFHVAWTGVAEVTTSVMVGNHTRDDSSLCWRWPAITLVVAGDRAATSRWPVIVSVTAVGFIGDDRRTWGLWYLPGSAERRGAPRRVDRRRGGGYISDGSGGYSSDGWWITRYVSIVAWIGKVTISVMARDQSSGGLVALSVTAGGYISDVSCPYQRRPVALSVTAGGYISAGSCPHQRRLVALSVTAGGCIEVDCWLFHGVLPAL